GDTLDVAGHCTGDFTIDKDLTLQGDGSTVLDGNGSGTTVTITGTPTVALGDLTVTGGTGSVLGGVAPGTFGGGIANFTGTVTLTRVSVIGNTASGDNAYGGGIYDKGTLTLVSSAV